VDMANNIDSCASPTRLGKKRFSRLSAR